MDAPFATARLVRQHDLDRSVRQPSAIFHDAPQETATCLETCCPLRKYMLPIVALRFVTLREAAVLVSFHLPGRSPARLSRSVVRRPTGQSPITCSFGTPVAAQNRSLPRKFSDSFAGRAVGKTGRCAQDRDQPRFSG